MTVKIKKITTKTKVTTIRKLTTKRRKITTISKIRTRTNTTKSHKSRFFPDY